MHLSHTWDITLEQIGTLLPPPTTLRRSLFLFNLYYHIKIYLPPISIKIFPDSGASICLAGIDYLSQLHLLHSDLTPCQKKVTAIGGSTLLCKRWLPMHLTIINQTTIQPLYFCLQLFPYPMLTAKKKNKKKKQQVSESTAPTIPPCTEATISPWLNKIPFTTTVENVPKLEQCLCSNFSSLPLVNHHCSLACLYHLLIFI